MMPVYRNLDYIELVPVGMQDVENEQENQSLQPPHITRFSASFSGYITPRLFPFIDYSDSHESIPKVISENYRAIHKNLVFLTDEILMMKEKVENSPHKNLEFRRVWKLVDSNQSFIVRSSLAVAWFLVSPLSLFLAIMAFLVKLVYDYMQVNYALSVIDVVGLFGFALLMSLSLGLRRQLSRRSSSQCGR